MTHLQKPEWEWKNYFILAHIVKRLFLLFKPLEIHKKVNGKKGGRKKRGQSKQLILMDAK